MHIIYCADPLASRLPDSAYTREVAAAQRLGLPYSLVDYEALVDQNDPERAVRRVPQQTVDSPALYRGWMLTPAQYTALYEALAGRGLRLINDPAAYRHCHYLPEWYATLAQHTPRSVWLELDDRRAALPMDEIMQALQAFGSEPLIVKDYVKSRKHEWNEACYIPSASDREAVQRVVHRFVELQAEQLSEGLVFREYLSFKPLTEHSRSGMPLTEEYRIFILDGQPVCTLQYWEEGAYSDQHLPVAHFAALARRVESRCFTMDVAQRDNGEWLVIELGDAQVAGLPAHADTVAVYQALTTHWPTT